jgi:hypothetical protein
VPGMKQQEEFPNDFVKLPQDLGDDAMDFTLIRGKKRKRQCTTPLDGTEVSQPVKHPYIYANRLTTLL